MLAPSGNLARHPNRSLSFCRSLHSDRTVPVINIAPPSRFKLSTFLRASHRRFRSRIGAMQLGTRMQMALQLTNESCRVLFWAAIKTDNFVLESKRLRTCGKAFKTCYLVLKKALLRKFKDLEVFWTQ